MWLGDGPALVNLRAGHDGDKEVPNLVHSCISRPLRLQTPQAQVSLAAVGWLQAYPRHGL